MTYRLFITDLLKSEMLRVVFSALLIPAIIWVIRWGGEYFFIYIWIFFQVLLVVMMWLLPTVIMPLFNKFDPIQDESLKQDIEALAARLEFPLYKLFQMDGSKRSAHSNAYMFGFWKFKRIVIFDTMLDYPRDSLLAVLGHELGHWKLNHTLKGIAIASFQTLVTFFVIGKIMFSDYSADIYASFGYADATYSKMMGVLLCGMLLEPIDEVLNRCMT